MRQFWLLRFGAACGVVLGLATFGPAALTALLALLAPLPDTPLTSAVHALAAASLIWVSATVWTSAPTGRPGAAPLRRAATAA